MRVNNDPEAPPQPPCRPRLPCIRDMHELVRDHLPPTLVKLASLKQLTRRIREIVAEHPRFEEEAPLVLKSEIRRRQLTGGQPVVLRSLTEVA